MMNLAGCLLSLICFPSLVSSWSPGKSRVIVSLDDIKSSEPLVTSSNDDWIPWNHGEVVSEPDAYGMEEHIASEYRKWAELHNKQPDPVHFRAFQRNYLDLLAEAEEGHGGLPFFRLNQYGDLTQEEHRREMLLLEAYHSWCQEYNKQQDPNKFEDFKQNLLHAVYESANNLEEDFHLGEFADCNPRSGNNHCIEPLNHSTPNGGRVLPSSVVKQIGNGVYVEYINHGDNESSSEQHNSHHESEESSSPTLKKNDSQIPPTFLNAMQHENRWKRTRNVSPYSNLGP
ncbi:unnamed protein product [Cylindrotheca closterium]|uniref:Cathepsin propeptide inhibitor domain-containing protein n=1 Tax=Cylindrotheca closterium TaxID=2856 RepID=A0AAD2FLJ8_9STRA|nr:unnamed protein product [Cylindrotheca closterium]